ncbi:MAG: hypothetical protein K2I79_00445, partial [Clostridia bacterium]|nr:hypothetical protein [Clostridia bacterium]
AIYSYNCFFLEGVFDDGVAVCNGLSKAFVVLCGIEGIPAVKIQGYTRLFPKSGRHAWNKVYIGGQWYGVDTTWGYAEDSGVRYVSHNYSFMSSSALNSTSHYQDDNVLGSNYYCGDMSYNFYADLIYLDGDILCDHIVDNKEELQALLAYYTGTYGGDKLVVYAYVNDIFTAKSITETEDNYKVKTINGKGGREYIYILEKQ